MTKEDYSEIVKACNNVYLPENWYIVFPQPEQLKNFESINCRTVLFVVTPIPLYDKKYLTSFKFIEDTHLVYDRLSHLPYLKKNISLIDYQVGSSHNRYLKQKTLSLTVHFVDKVQEAMKILDEK